MTDLAAFLLARIAEDEKVARGAIHWSEGASQWGAAGEPDWEHIARHDPARVLAECEVKRRLTAWHGDRHVCEDGLRGGEMLRWDEATDTELFVEDSCDVLRLLSLPYADHPDYREEWRP